MLQSNRGFTLIEILVVVIIMAAVLGVVAPVAYKSVGRFNAFLGKKEIVDIKNMANYLSFIKDTTCRVKKGVVMCDNNSYSSLEDALK